MFHTEVILVDYKDKAVLRQLMEFYMYDFSEMEGLDVNAHGRFEYKYLDHYWTEDGRYPYFILVDGKYAGFVLVKKRGVLNEDCFFIAEFFVMKKYRRNGVGHRAATQVFDRHRGAWEVGQIKNNLVAHAFWRKVINQYTKGQFFETIVDDDRWHGPIQTFTNWKEAE